MFLKFSWFRLLCVLLPLALVACGGGGSPAAAPTGVSVTAGGGQAVLTFQAQPGVTYWLLYAPQSTPLDLSNPPGTHTWITPPGGITSPYTVTGLSDGTTYAFAINGRVNGGKGGPSSATVYATPRPAGGTWTTPGTLGSNTLRSVSYGTASDNSVNYVAVGDAGSIYHSLDGSNWTRSTTAPLLNYKTTVYAFGQFLAAGTGDPSGYNVYHSTDMVDWLVGTTAVGAGLNAMASSGSAVVGVGSGGAIWLTSDGSNWTQQTSGTSANLNGVVYSANLGLWIAVGNGGTVLTSSNGTSWTAQTSNAGTNNLYAVAVSSAGQVVAVGQAGTIVSSANGVNWSTQTLLATSNDLYAVTVDSQQFMAVGASGAAVAAVNPSSVTNGAWTGTWTSPAAAGTGATLYGLYGSSALYVAVGQAGALRNSQ